MNKFDKKLDEIDKKFKDDPTDEEREELKKEFWRTAVEAFNEDIAGDITLIDGRVINVPEI